MTVPKNQKPYVKLNDDYIQSQTQSVSAQITDLENRLSAVRALQQDISSGTAIWDTASQGTATVDAATGDSAVQLMQLIRERKQYLNEFCTTRHVSLKRSTPPDDPRQQYRRTYH